VPTLSQRVQEIYKIIFLLVSETDIEALVVKIDGVKQWGQGLGNEASLLRPIRLAALGA